MHRKRTREQTASLIIQLTMVLSILGWFGNAVAPDTVSNILLFLLLIFAASVIIGKLIFVSTRRALIMGFGVVAVLILRFVELREFYYPLAIAAIALIADWYTAKL